MVKRPLYLWEIMRPLEIHQFVSKTRMLLNLAMLGQGTARSREDERTAYFLKHIASEATMLQGLLQQSALPMTAKWVDRVKQMVELQLTGARIDFEALERGIGTLTTTLEDELSTRVYFEMEPQEVTFWNLKKGCGDRVSESFPSTDYEIEEFSKCFAVGRYTAAIFHLMRVLEIGLSSLAVSIGCDPSDKSWEKILSEIQCKLNENGSKKPEGWKAIEQFYSEVSAQFRNLKNAWRNYTMHVHVTYDKERAEEIFSHVRSVMRLLSTKIQE